MNPKQAKSSPSQARALQTLSLSNIEEGMGHNVKRFQELQQELPQQRASLQQESAVAQAQAKKLYWPI